MNAIRNSINHLLTYENIHMSKRIIDSIHFENYCNAPIVSMKPRGFWYSLGTEWLEWVRNEEPHWEYQFLYELIIDKSKLFIINDSNDLTDFIANYLIPRNSSNSYNYFELNKIDWYKLAKEYSGIEFRNYKKSYQLQIKYVSIPTWYDGIDVSSGCIWDKNALLSVNLIQEDCK